MTSDGVVFVAKLACDALCGVPVREEPASVSLSRKR
jgi:hypothetical protein